MHAYHTCSCTHYIHMTMCVYHTCTSIYTTQVCHTSMCIYTTLYTTQAHIPHMYTTLHMHIYHTHITDLPDPCPISSFTHKHHFVVDSGCLPLTLAEGNTSLHTWKPHTQHFHTQHFLQGPSSVRLICKIPGIVASSQATQLISFLPSARLQTKALETDVWRINLFKKRLAW